MTNRELIVLLGALPMDADIVIDDGENLRDIEIKKDVREPLIVLKATED